MKGSSKTIDITTYSKHNYIMNIYVLIMLIFSYSFAKYDTPKIMLELM